MSTYSFMASRRPRRTIDDLDFKQALQRGGGYGDAYDRIRAALNLAAELGEDGIAEASPYLVRCIADERNLRVAWDHIRQYGGRSTGPDGQQWFTTPERAIWPALKTVSADLASGRYRVTEAEERIRRISKGAGRGERVLTVQNHNCRLAQRATLQVLDPLLDPKLDELCFGGRLRRGPHAALATAEQISRTERRCIVVPEDLKDAFRCVPVPRLLEIVERFVPDKPTITLLKGMLAGSRTPGLRQGGALSPLLLAIYLEHCLLRKWRKRHPNIPLLIYIDDLLLMCRSDKEARTARQSLIELLKGTGLRLKKTDRDSICHLTSDSAVWLGYQIRKRSGRLVVNIPDGALDRLVDSLQTKSRTMQHGDARPGELSEQPALEAWANYYGPCFASSRAISRTFSSIEKRISARNLPLRIKFAEFDYYCKEAVEVWMRVRDRVACRSTFSRCNEVAISDWLTD